MTKTQHRIDPKQSNWPYTQEQIKWSGRPYEVNCARSTQPPGRLYQGPRGSPDGILGYLGILNPQLMGGALLA